MKTQRPPQTIWIAATVVLGLIFINCNTLLPTPAPPAPPPTPVVIQEVSDLTASRTELPANETAEITVSIIKVLGDETPLTYQWSTTGGLITQGQGTCCIVYEAPDTPGGYQVHLTVGHGDQLFQRSLELVVTGPAEVLSDTVTLEPTPTPTLVVSTDPSPTADNSAAAPPLDDAVAYFNRAQNSYTRRDYEQTVNDYTKAIELNYEPLGEAYFNRGFVYYVQRDYRPAVADFTQAIDLERDPLSQVYYNRGNAHYYLGNHDRAIEDYTKAIDLNHDPLSWLYNSRGLAYRKIGEYERAVEDYSQAIDLGHDPLHWPYYNRGNAYADLGEYARAVEDYNEAIHLAPNEPSAYFARGVAYQELGEASLARADWNKVLEIGDDYWRQEAQTRLDEPTTEETTP